MQNLPFEEYLARPAAFPKKKNVLLRERGMTTTKPGRHVSSSPEFGSFLLVTRTPHALPARLRDPWLGGLVFICDVTRELFCFVPPFPPIRYT